MVKREGVDKVINSMILSASGWRGIFAAGEEDAESQISDAHKVICGAAAFVFAEYLKKKAPFTTPHSPLPTPLILVGTDTRPTGKAIADIVIKVLFSCECNVRYAGIVAVPEIMAFARSIGGSNTGFIYISASHNPIGHNGLKFGLDDGGVLAGEESAKLITDFRAFLKNEDSITRIENLISSVNPEKLKDIYDGIPAAKAEAKKIYYAFTEKVAWEISNPPNNNSVPSVPGRAARDKSLAPDLSCLPLSCATSCCIETSTPLRGASLGGLRAKSSPNIGIVCDFNGSARTVSIDREIFSSLGIKFECINGEPGQIAHRIVPEGESLEPCRTLLEDAHRRDEAFVLGYVPDCDGDRGNLVIWDDTAGIARALDAQEVFALACMAELSHLVRTGELSFNSEGKPLNKAAVAANDPTSMRIDIIAEAFGASVFRAETGEANVVSLACRLREEGYIVRILGEGSAGGTITHPSKVRDPINTVLSLVKLLSIRSEESCSPLPTPNSPLPGFFEIWCRLSGQTDKYRDDFTLADIIASLPKFSTTPVYSADAVLRIKTENHATLKEHYQKIFLREWEERKGELRERCGICGWEAIAYNGTAEKRNLVNFGEAGRGGLKILFTDIDAKAIAFIWMRGSATEPVFRIMADARGADSQFERDLLEWQSRMIMEADELMP